MAHITDYMKEDELIEHCKALSYNELHNLFELRGYAYDENESESRNIRIFAEKANAENARLDYQ